MKSSSSSSLSQDKFYINAHGGMGRLGSFLFYSLALTTVFSFFLLFSPNSVKILPKSSVHYDQARGLCFDSLIFIFRGRVRIHAYVYDIEALMLIINYLLTG